MWDLIGFIPNHCLSIYFLYTKVGSIYFTVYKSRFISESEFYGDLVQKNSNSEENGRNDLFLLFQKR